MQPLDTDDERIVYICRGSPACGITLVRLDLKKAKLYQLNFLNLYSNMVYKTQTINWHKQISNQNQRFEGCYLPCNLQCGLTTPFGKGLADFLLWKYIVNYYWLDNELSYLRGKWDLLYWCAFPASQNKKQISRNDTAFLTWSTKKQTIHQRKSKACCLLV